MHRLEKIISSIEIILKAVHEGIVIADKDGRVVYVNDANERITGLDNRRILGKRVKDVVMRLFYGTRCLWARPYLLWPGAYPQVSNKPAK